MGKTIMAVAVVGGALTLAACATQPASRHEAAALNQPGQASQQKAAVTKKGQKVCIAGKPAAGSHLSQAQANCMTKKDYVAYKKAEAKNAPKPKTRKVCTSSKRIGSHLVHTTCVTLTEAEYKAYMNAKYKQALKAQHNLQHAEQTGGGGLN